MSTTPHRPPSVASASSSSSADQSGPSDLTQRLGAIGRSLAWTMLWLGVLSLSGGLGLLAYQRLTALPPVPDCSKLSPLAADAERLFCAREAAQTGTLADLTAAVDLVRDWPSDHPLNRNVQSLLSDWSKALMRLAHQEISQSNLLGAVDIASRIPANSALFEDAQAAIADWQYQWDEGEAIYQTAQTALQTQDWDLANQQLRALGELDNDYWRQQKVDALAQQILTEKSAWQTLQRSRQIASESDPARLGEALRLIQTISPQSYAWRAGAAELSRWSQLLVSYGMQQWEAGNLDAAIAIVEPVPPDPDLAPDAYDFLQFSYAQRRAQVDADFWKPTLPQLAGLQEAIAIAQQIRPESPFYESAQTSAQTWQAMIDDALHLTVSDWVARLGSRQALATAIAHAGQIGSDRPRRVQAQTLVAHWQQEIERLEDQPILLAATQLAEPGTIPALQSAIAQAQQIQPDRALRIEAQTAIAQWQQQIQRIEDQPLLDEALALAAENRLQDAIRAAGRIRRNRALYADAQAYIQDWQTEIRDRLIAVDRDVLDEAYELAAKEWYSAAIDVASQLSSDRPLYGEAQGAIAQWRIERDALLQQWGVAPEPAQPTYSEPVYSEDYRDYYSPDYQR